MDNKTRVRLRQLDAPELKYCYGPQAKELLEKLVLNKNIRLEELVPDQQGRGMGLIYVGDKLINQELLAEGLARFHHDVSTKNEQLKTVAAQAEDKKLGLYGACQSMTNLKNAKCQIKGNIADGKKIYHIPGCVQYSFAVVEEDLGEQWFCSEKEAVAAGYTKSARCKIVSG